MLKTAVKNNLNKDNPFNAVKFIKHKSKIGKAFNLDEQKRFFEALENDSSRLLYMVYITTGLRRNEALALTPASINFDNNYIVVKYSIVNDKELGTTKTAKTRTVPIRKDIAKEIKKLKLSNNERIFKKTSDYASRHFQEICENAGISGYKLHDLRYTFATRALEAGVPLKVLQVCSAIAR